MFKFGWGGHKLAEAEWDLIGSDVPEFKIIGDQGKTAGTTTRLWDLVRAVNAGQDLYFNPQETGDCVAVSAGDGLEILQYCQMATGDLFKPRRLFAPFNYGVARVIIGRNQIRGAGCVGSWLAKSVSDYGTLDEGTPNLPVYSGELADNWGNSQSRFKPYMGLAKPFVCSWARIMNWSDLVRAIRNRYVLTMASSLGFEMLARKDGFHHPSGSWEHQMSIIAVCDGPNPWLAVKNQWGDVHGLLRDFETEEFWPRGVMRVRPESIESAYRNGEIIAYSQYQGFPDRTDEVNEWDLAN